MPQRILGLDIGSWSVKGVVLENYFRGFKVIDAQEVPIPAGPAEDRRELVQQAIRELTAVEPFSRIDAYVTAVPGQQSTSRFITLPYADTKKVDQTIPGELADLVPFEADESVSDHALLHKTVDGGSISLATTVARDTIEETLALTQELGIDPRFLSVDVIQLYNLYTHFLKADQSKPEEPSKASPEADTFILANPAGPPSARLLVDVGHERTLVAACAPDGLAYVRVLRHGGAEMTRAIAKAFALSFEEAEALKHSDGFIASSRQPPPSEDAHQMSKALEEGLLPLVRELRRTLLAIRSEKRVHVARIDLLGGGSKVRNLANYLAEEVNVPAAPGLAAEQLVERCVDASRRPAYALALALALRSAGDEPVAAIDLRRGEFQFAGQLEHLRTRLPFVGISAAALVLLVMVNVWVSYYTIGAREELVDEQFCKITKEVINREICEPKQAISVMAQPVSELGNVNLPARSALNIAAELSARIPEDVTAKAQFKIDEIDITPDRARISGETDSFDAVDKIVAELGKDPCYSNIKKGRMQRKSDGSGIEFQLTMRLECSS